MFLRKFTFVTASVLAASALLGLGLMTTPALLNRVQADEQPPAAEAGRPAEQQPPAGEKPLPKGDAANQQPPPPKPVELPREQPAKPVERAPLDLLVPQKTLRVYHEDEANILGNWRVTSVVVDGQHRDPQDKTIVIGPFGTALVRNSTKPGDEQPMTYKLDPEAKPAAIDLIAAGKTQPGIYQVQGNALTLCMNVRDGARPTELIGSKGSGQVVLTLSRIGPASNTGWAQAILGQNATHDFGVIKPGDRVTHQVKIKNPYDRPISVASVATYSFRHQEDRALPGSVHPRLGSDLIEIPNSPLLVTASNLPTRWIEPGEEATITLEASSNQLRGAGKKAVLIHFQIRGLNGAPVPLGARLSGISGGAPFGPPAMGFVMRQHLGPEGALARLIVTARSADSQPKP